MAMFAGLWRTVKIVAIGALVLSCFFVLLYVPSLLQVAPAPLNVSKFQLMLSNAVSRKEAVYFVQPGTEKSQNERPAPVDGGVNTALNTASTTVTSTKLHRSAGMIVSPEHAPSPTHVKPAQNVIQERSRASLPMDIPTVRRQKKSYLIDRQALTSTVTGKEAKPVTQRSTVKPQNVSSLSLEEVGVVNISTATELHAPWPITVGTTVTHVPVLSPILLKPVKKVSQDRSGVSLVIGIPTVHRQKQTYLIGTLKSLISNLLAFDKRDVLIVVMVADMDSAKVNAVFEEVQSHYAAELQSGMMDIIAPPPEIYPDIASMKPTLGDPKDRFYWRTKEVIDCAYVMTYSRSRGLYYLMLEDDIQAMPNFALSIIERAKRDSAWDLLEFSIFGSIGKLFRSSEVTAFVDFILANASKKPVDWLLNDWFNLPFCSLEKGKDDCKRGRKKRRSMFKPSLFQHVGYFSSLKGKIQTLRDPNIKEKN